MALALWFRVIGTKLVGAHVVHGIRKLRHLRGNSFSNRASAAATPYRIIADICLFHLVLGQTTKGVSTLGGVSADRADYLGVLEQQPG